MGGVAMVKKIKNKTKAIISMRDTDGNDITFLIPLSYISGGSSYLLVVLFAWVFLAHTSPISSIIVNTIMWATFMGGATTLTMYLSVMGLNYGKK